MEGTSRHDFSLPEEDEALLNASFPSWETVKYNNENLVLINHFPEIPEEYNCSDVTVAFLIPTNYPRVQIDMFYVYPPLQLNSKTIPATQCTKDICGKSFQRWSRHRTPQNPWRPEEDNIYSQVMLTEEMIAREVQNATN